MKQKIILSSILSLAITACGSVSRADEKNGKENDTMSIDTAKKRALIKDTLISKSQKDTFITKFPGSIDSKGRRQGYIIFMHYNVDTVAGMVTFYRNDTAIWSTFPLADMNFQHPVKGRSAIRDYRIAKKSDIYIVSPYNDTSNTIFYEGRFLNGKRVGIHKIYHTNGHLKFEVNWDTHKCKEFDRAGKFKKEGPVEY
ncbi:MAG TPA: hypothetical protein VK177_03355 [Flavobacteriales bacterium]|nr:hypothetical protein [Flavobacteriales bacterium]